MTAVVLPPLEAGRSDQDAKSRLAQLRLLQVVDALDCSQVELSGLRHAHVRNEERRQEDLVQQQNRQRRREAKQERMRMKHVSATKLQSLVRSFFIRRFVLPSVLELKRNEELEKSRVTLMETMLGLHQNIHDLAFLEQDRDMSATHIQSWWRGVLAKRVVAIVMIRHHLAAVSAHMAQAATRVQSLVRGRQARSSCLHLRMQKEKRMQKAKKQQNDRMMKAIIKIQCHQRRRLAQWVTQTRRQMVVKELDGDVGGAATTDARTDTARKSTARRKKNAGHDSHHGSTSNATSPKKVTQHDVPSVLEAGGMVAFAEGDHVDGRRKSVANHAHKARKLPRKTLAG